MVDAAPDPAGGDRWRAVGDTVVGATHRRAGIPNQDALLLPASGGLPLVVAVSDGHGSPKCFRSHLGSRLAVGVAALVLRELLGRAADGAGYEGVAAEVARRWTEAVMLDLTLSPFTAAELAALEERSGADARRLVESSPALAYGATVLAAAVGERAHVYLQLGDGDILAVSESGDVARPLPDDARLFADETTSLASPSAVRDFRVRVAAVDEREPALLLLTTDGYVNSFRDDAGFLKVGADILEMIACSSLDAVAADVGGWLDEATRLGSGDDVTLAIAFRTTARCAVAETPAAPEPTEPAAEVETEEETEE
jgi:serine/threonine protein phosphatase PrpC